MSDTNSTDQPQDPEPAVDQPQDPQPQDPQPTDQPQAPAPAVNQPQPVKPAGQEAAASAPAGAGASANPEVQHLVAQRQIHTQNLSAFDPDLDADAIKEAQDAIKGIDDRLGELGHTG